MPEITIEDINEARSLIYAHIMNDKLRNALYRELNNIEDNIKETE